MDLGSFFYGFWIYIFGCFLMDFGLNVDNCLIDLLLFVYVFGQARFPHLILCYLRIVDLIMYYRIESNITSNNLI